MIYNINGEQPFQVLSESFSVSPSQSGYDLYFSADGRNYSKFATVESGVNRQFTGMNEGNYYILSGNTSEVKVNWMKDCSGGGGGGSTAGVSSLDGQTGALTTKTINGNAILGSGDIVISGGSSDVVIYNFAEWQASTAEEKTAMRAKWTADFNSGKTVYMKAETTGSDTIYLLLEKLESYDQFRYASDAYLCHLSINNSSVVGAQGEKVKKVDIITKDNKASANQLGVVKVGSGLTIDSNGVLSVSGGSSSGPTVIDFDSMTQQERATLFTTIYDKYTGTTDGINNEYVFYKTFNNWTPGNAKDRKFRLQFALGDSSRLLFSYVTAHMDYGNYAHSWRAWLYSDGNMGVEDADIKGLTADVRIAGSYFQGGHTNCTLTFNKATSAFTAEGDGISDPVTSDWMDAILYWAGFHNGANVEGPTVIRLKFNVIDNGETTSYYFPSLSCKSITPVTIGDYTFNEEGTANYGSFTVKFLMSSDPVFGNLTFVENY